MPICSKCEERNARPNQRWCRFCHAKYVREHRKPLTEEQRLKGIARSYAKVYRKRGHIQWQACEQCHSMFSEMHHEDYSKPLDVRWLCRPCHLAAHAIG